MFELHFDFIYAFLHSGPYDAQHVSSELCYFAGLANISPQRGHIIRMESRPRAAFVYVENGGGVTD
jgi:hypothetical protein